MDDAVRFFWDYCAFPVWSGGQLPAELESALWAWSDEGTEKHLAEVSGTPLPPGWVGEWSNRGRVLAHRVSGYLGPVDYTNEATGETERVTG